MAEIFPVIGLGLTVVLGGFGLILPGAVAKLVGMVPAEPLGRSEIRATYGGLFIGLGGAGLFLQSPEAYLVAGLAWLSAAAGRAISIIVDRDLSPKNFGGILVEAGLGGLLLTGML